MIINYRSSFQENHSHCNQVIEARFKSWRFGAKMPMAFRCGQNYTDGKNMLKT